MSLSIEEEGRGGGGGGGEMFKNVFLSTRNQYVRAEKGKTVQSTNPE